MNSRLQTNVLIIGKSGVGKSSLLNYIFGENKVDVGAGSPITKKGIFVEQFVLSNDFIVNVSDTWGLEANKAEEWKKLISDEVKKHDCSSIVEWFHTIFYCFSAKAARVEKFEKDIIKELISNGNKVIIILTHCDVNNVDKSIEQMSNELINETGIGEKDIIKVCSIGKKLLGGRQTQAFGRDEVINQIKANLWGTICNKIPKILKDYKDRDLNNWCERCCTIIDNDIKWYNYHSDRQFRKISEKCSDRMKETIRDIEVKIESIVGECCAYYNSLSEQFGMIETNKKFNMNINSSFQFSMDFLDKLVENFAGFILNLIPLGIFFSSAAIADAKRDEIKQAIYEYKENVNEKVEDEMNHLIDQLKGWYKL